MAVREEQHLAPGGRASTRSMTLSAALGDFPGRLASGPRTAPYAPTRVRDPDLGRCQALQVPVIPLHQVVVDLRLEARQLGSAQGTLTGAGPTRSKCSGRNT